MPGIMTGLFIYGVYMAYQPEVMRPELQRDNANRNGLNIQQPGEDNWRDSFFSDPENAVDHSKSFSLGDVLPTVGTGAAQSVQGTGEMARGLGDALIHSPLKTTARIANELSRLGLPGVATIEDIFSGTGKSADKTIDALPDGKNRVTDAIGKGLKVTGKGVSDVAGAVKDWSYDKMSPGAQRALNTPMSDGWDDSAVWVAKGANLIGSLLPDLAAGGITKKVGEVALEKSLTGALEKKFITAGLPPEKAAAYASESVKKSMPDLFQMGMVTSSTASAQGSEAMNAADSVRNADYSELVKSPKFQQTFYTIDSDPQYAGLSDRQKMDMAKDRVADEVRAQLATDPQSLVVNALAAKLGDAQLVNLALRGTAKSVASGVARNVAEQAGINAAQGGFSRYQENAALRDTAGMDVPEWQGVSDAALEGGVMGGAMGAPFGAVAGLRGKRQSEADMVARQNASRQAFDAKAARAQEMAQDSPYTKPADPVENYRQQFSGLSRDELLQHYADADLAPEHDTDAVYRKHAANGLLKDMDRADQLKSIVDEIQGKPRNEVLAEYRELNEKDNRNAAEQMRWEAAREVLRPQQKATEQPQPEQDTSAQNTVRRPLYDADNLDIPAFMRDPRFRDFTDEPTEVQQHLTRRNVPTPEELVHEQMAKGDAGPTDSELAERPRLPSPGDIHPGQGYPMPGEVRRTYDEPPAGRGGRYTTTGEVQGHSYEKGRQSVSSEGVPRQGETFRGEQSYRELPAPERQGLPRPEEVKPENAETVNTERGTTPEVDEGEQNQSQPEAQKPEKTESPHAATEKSGEKIDDFGEVIHGAAKHRRAALAEDLNTDKTAEDYRTQPFSKLFPKPDYEKMAAEGTDNKTLAMLALLRNMIPAKPRVSHRLNHWAKQVKEVRDTAGQLLEGSLPADKFIDRISQEKGSHYREIVNTWEMLHRLSPAQIEQASGYRVKTHAYSMFGGKEYSPPKVIHTLENEKGRSVLDSEDLNDLHKKAKDYFDQQSESPKSADDKTKLDIYQHKRSGEVFIAYGKNKTVLQRGFKTVAEAREYVKANRAELLKKLNDLREQSREEQRNVSNRDRNGPVRRGGEMHTDVNALRNISGSGAGYSEKAASLKRKIAARMNTNDAFAFNRLMDSRFADERERGIAIAERVAAALEPEQNATPEKFSDAFGFRGVQFGNYVEGPRRQSDLNRAYDALMDMADVLKVPAKALSLDGRLGLAFGARGRGGKNAAAAHYEPGQVAINLTKGNGAGSLAHEWFHALDNYFGQHDVAKDGNVVSGDRFMTARDTRGSLYQPEAYPVREEVYDAFMGVVKAVNDSGMRRRSLLLDDVRSKPYWSTHIEMTARAFERYVQDKAKAAGVDNDFLVNIRKADDHGSPDTYAYPTNEELNGGIRHAFDKLFSTLKTRDTDKGVAFYSREVKNKPVRTTWQKDFPDVVLHARLGDATSHRDYEAAKAGDKDAAYRLVSDVLTKEAVDKIRDIIGNREVLLAAVHAEEASGRNKIPQAMADVLGKVLHQEVATGIVQTKRVGRTGQDGFGRLANQPEFAGNVRSDLPYFILDDTLTQGGTLAGLKGYIESHGGRVIGASALTGKQYSARMALSSQTLSRLREHFGGTGLENWWKQQHGYGFDGLTESEANYLLRAGNADKIRDRILAARSTGDSQVLSEAPGDGRPLSPDVKSRYAQKASDTGGFSVIGDGNLLSETGHSPEAKGSPVPQVRAAARTVLNRIKDIDLNVRVVKSQAEAAELAGESLDKHGKVHAFYRPDEREIVLVADNLPDGRSVREKLRHEIIHHAMENVVTPAEYKTIVNNVLKTRDSDNATIKDIWRKVDASYGKESPEVQAGEFLAHMAEKHTPGKLGAAWNRVVSLIKAVLRRTGLLQPSDLNDIGYIRDTIRTLGQRVREGYRPSETGGDVSYSRTGKPDPFKVPEGEGERYRRDLAKAVKSHRSSDISVTVGRTPPVLRHIGAPDLPLVISRDTVRKATNGVKHDVPMEVIEQLPELMHDPEAVYQSATEKNAVVMLFDAVDKNGDPVIGAVHLKANRKGLEINKIASVYGAFPSKLSKMDREGLALYKKQNPDNQSAGVLQLHGDSDHQGSVNKILQPDDIRKGPYYSRTLSDLSPEETLAARFVRHMQDKFQVLKAVQDNIRKSGGKIDDSNNAYMAEELFHGKAENDLNAMKERYIQPLAKLLAQYDIPQSALDEYLYARHAPERNAHIAKINPKMPDGGSGMTNAEAADIMDKVRRSGKQAQYDRLAGIVDDMLARRRELITSGGLENEGVVDAWQKAYKHYVPLKGQDADGTVPRTGRGFVISGKESKMAMGRNSRAQSPSTQAIQDLTESLIRNRKNEVGNAFLKLVQDNPDKDYWQVFTDDKPDTTRRIVERNDPATGETVRQVEEVPVPMAMMSDKYFTTKKDGKTYYIKLHDERLMRAMKNMGPETGNVVIRTLGAVNRMMSMMNTSLNPEFLVSNFIRDMQTAVMNLKAEQGRDDGKLNGHDIALKTVRDSGIAMKAVYASMRDKTLSGRGAEWQKAWKEFVEDGGKTGWFRMDDLSGRMKEMDRLVSQAKGGWKGQGIQSWHAFTKLVEDANGAVENALRLSAYKHAREAGLSRAQAASLAKNMTVNFNRRGEQGVLLNSLYMFANASIQGTANMMRSLAHLNGEGPVLQRLRWKNLNVAQKLALTATGAGYLLASLNRAGAGQDDDGVNWYDKVPDYVKEHNLVIMKSLFGGKAGEYWSIPLPYGYNMFFLLGNTVEGVTRGNLTASKAAGNIVGGALGAFNPLGSEDSKTLSGTLFKNAAPTILRPLADLWANESFMGTPIYRTNFPGGTPKPESTLGGRSTPEAYKAFANWLNTVSGGSQYRSGAIDINPDMMKYWIDYVAGGMGRFAAKTSDAVVKSYNGIDIPSQQIPFLGKISGQVMPYADQQTMYDRIDELRQYNAELKSLHGADRAAFREKYRGQISMNGIIHQSEIQLKNLRKQRDAIYSDPSLTAGQQAEKLKAVELNMKKVVDRFNREYREKVKD
ncbi:TPA: LPD38 domain-containing protein [Salmonella enterica subsp. enterica serovar Chester]